VKRRIFLRVFIGYVLLSVLALAAFAVFTLNLSRALSLDALSRGLRSSVLTAKASVEPLMAGGRSPALDALVAALGKEGSVRFTVIDRTGLVLADSEQDPAAMENHSLRPEVAAALAGRLGVSQRFSATLRRWMIYVAVPVASTGGVVRAATVPEELDAAGLRTRQSLAVFAPIVAAVCLLFAYLLSRSITAPLSDLADVVGRFAAGDFAARLHLRRRDEVRTLADTFNAMAERVHSLFLERDLRTQELDSIFSSVQQGILVLDSAGRIVRSNRGFEAMARTTAVRGKTLWEVLRAPRLTELVQIARASGQRQSEEVAMGERTVLCSVERVEGREDLIVVLHDTTDLRRLEAVKRDFVVNASHELRTPLTSIIGSLELLEAEVQGDPARWVQAIRRNAERMSAIVKDMLLLSRLEDRSAEPAREPVDVGAIAREVVDMFAPKAREQGIELRVREADGLPKAEADGFLVEQMLVNLVDNALKYTEKGSVDVACSRDGPFVRIEVADTGIGIAEEHIPRIFERFYVVDKSRSRKLGGTGLGLAIVKHIVAIHRGSIDVVSEPGKGTLFTVRLPVS
jgi:two-component system phosphate regulon sensor histidine kinase PhoR